MKKIILLLSLAITFSLAWSEKDYQQTNSGITSVEARKHLVVKRNAKGNTLEQQNIIDGYIEDNKPGAIKHLYVISTFTGKVLRYSTVKGKVTSNSKTLSPSTVTPGYRGANRHNRGMLSKVHNKLKRTTEVMQESGTFGSSYPYIFWFDVHGIYHKMLMNHSAYVEISNQPLPVQANGELQVKFK